MSDSIAIPSYYSYTNSVVMPSSVLTSYSYPHDAAPSYDDEPDYPANYEASPVGDYHDINADTDGSAITSTDVKDNKEEFPIYDSHIVKATVTD
jgi:hypothetical protein